MCKDSICNCRVFKGIKEKKGEGGISTLPTRRPVDQEKAGAMLGDLEFRSDIAPFLESNPVAKLGFKLFEDVTGNMPARFSDALKRAPYTTDRCLVLH